MPRQAVRELGTSWPCMQGVVVKKVNKLVINAISMRLVDTLVWAITEV